MINRISYFFTFQRSYKDNESFISTHAFGKQFEKSDPDLLKARGGVNMIDESDILLERVRREVDETDIRDALCKVRIACRVMRSER
jgi:hypothetical protein